MRHYSQNLTGFSLGEHPPEICWGTWPLPSSPLLAAARGRNLTNVLMAPVTGTLCPVGPVQWNPVQDRLNAALSGSLATNLMHQARGASVQHKTCSLQPGLTAVSRLRQTT
jgi:hypothetical protein